MKTLILLFLFFSNILAQDDSITKLFPGKWKMISDNIEYFEEWELLNEKELAGAGFSTAEGDTILSERLFLKKFDDTWTYVAMPSNQNITLFALTDFSVRKFIFQNDEHDFPQKIIYEFLEDGKLTAAIEGIVSGEVKRREFNYMIVED
ncbi:MAG: hypothetical protein IPM14_13215 [bacterium]|nr:hypothetical protein [bacterium]